MATDTETAKEVPFEEKFGDLVSQRTQALRDRMYHKRTGFQRGVIEATAKAAKSYAGMVSSAAGYLSEKDPQERSVILEQLEAIGLQQSQYGIESVGFDHDRFKEDVQNALEAAEEQAKEPSLV